MNSVLAHYETLKKYRNAILNNHKSSRLNCGLNLMDVGFVGSLQAGVAVTKFFDHVDDAGTTVEEMNEANNDGRGAGMELQSGAADIGKAFQELQVKLKKVGTPEGTYRIEIYAGDTTIVNQSPTLNAVDLTTSLATKTLTLDSKHTLSAGDRVVVQTAGGSSTAGNFVGFAFVDSGQQAGWFFTRHNYDDSWLDLDLVDFRMTFDSSV